METKHTDSEGKLNLSCPEVQQTVENIQQADMQTTSVALESDAVNCPVYI